VRQRAKSFQEYLRLRKKVLGLDELHLYDLNVPLSAELDWKISYEEAVSMVTNAVKPLGEEYSDILQAAWRRRWIDVYENAGKRSGAYSWGVYRIHPYVLLNYEQTLHDVFTLAHEMGHAMHSFLAHREQDFRYAHYPIFIAEIASTLNEALLLHALLQSTTERDKRKYLLAHYLNNFRATLFVQTLFAEFEKRIHEIAEASKPLTPDTFNSVFLELHHQYYGDALTMDGDEKIGWMRIPHFYSSFYVYKYATGFSAANSFCRRIIKNNGEGVVPYLELLKSGGKDYPLELLKTARVDMSSNAPILEALDSFDESVEELKGLL
jgi:oligoendopeptidase F